MARSAVRSTHPAAQEAAEQSLRSGANALVATMTGFFAAAGADAGVLFSPLVLLVSGLGTGVFAYDGRVRQPGRGAKRPRGFTLSDEIPDVARAAVPTGLAALAVASAFHPGTSLLSCARAGVAVAKADGKKSRAELIDRVAGMGARALFEPALKRELLTRFGAVEKGSLTPEDLFAPMELQHPVVRGMVTHGGREQTGLLPPWQQEPRRASGDRADDVGRTDGLETEGNDPAAARGHALCAIDARGMCTALQFHSLSSSLYLERFEVAFPALALPVLRGVTRKSPGEPIAALGSTWLIPDLGGHPRGTGASAWPNGPRLELDRDPDSKQVVVFSGALRELT